MPKKNNVIKYTDRDFDTIKQSLINYAQRHYPDTYKDFQDAGFGALMTDYVAYIGDILSFYLDYQANETFLDTANEFDNIVRIAKTLGFKFEYNYSSQGLVSFFATIPALTSDPTSINTNYAPTIKKGAIVTTEDGSSFILTEDINFEDPSNQREVAIVDSTTGLPSFYAVRAVGQVVSGQAETVEIEVGDFERFRQVLIDDEFVTEIISVLDSEGNEYFEVDHLSQNVVYKELKNKNAPNDKVPSIMKPVLVARRFTTEKNSDNCVLQFGFGSDQNLSEDLYARPQNIAVQKFGRPYVSSTTFDPSNLIQNDKFGIAPANTALTIVYLKNSSLNPNASQGQINTLSDFKLVFPGTSNVTTIENQVRESMACSNDESIVGSVNVPDADELRVRAISFVNSQRRAVTKQDYESLCYAMPSQFGAVKRVRAAQDKDSFKKNINLYVISEDQNGNFTETNTTIKKNIQTYLARHKMISDTVDILDAKIVNVAINFTVVGDEKANKFDVIEACNKKLETMLSVKYDIGEPIFYNDFFRELKDAEGVLDVVEVFATVQSGGLYATTTFSIPENLSADGTRLLQLEDHVFEVKYFDRDLIGTVL